MVAKAQIRNGICGWMIVPANEEAQPLVARLYGHETYELMLAEKPSERGFKDGLDALIARIKEVAVDCCISVSFCGKKYAPTLLMWDKRRPVIVPERLPCMSGHWNGSHCGLADWYPEIEAGIQEALNRGRKYAWTTDWYSSKKEIASACITHVDGKITVDVSVSDDFDTPGRGTCTIRHTTKLEKIANAIYQAWEEAEDDRKDNQVYMGFSILKDDRWIETLILPTGEGHCMDSPPGDNYFKWGLQNDSELPSEVEAQLEALCADEDWDYDERQIGEYVVKPW